MNQQRIHQQRIRIRFRKESDLRLISHRDLLRLFERLFRRAGFKLRMSEGFHPKAKMSFPSALGLGIEGADEALDIELTEALPLDEIQRQIAAHAPPGISINSVRALSRDDSKARAQRLTYEIAVPPERIGAVRAAIDSLLVNRSFPVSRPGRDETIDLLEGLEGPELCEERLRFSQCVRSSAMARPGEVLKALGLDDLESQGSFLTRTQVELAS